MRAADRRKADATTAPAADAITLETFAATYVERVSEVRERNKSWKNDRYMLAQIAAFTLTDGSRLGDKALGAITEDDLEAVLLELRAKGRAASTRNQYVQVLKASFRWATKKGYLPRNPISRTRRSSGRRSRSGNRRLVPDVLDEDGT